MRALVILFAWLLVGHALCDYPLQGDFLARAKNHRQPLPGIAPAWGLFFHALLHAAAVGIITGRAGLALLELVLHIGIDYLKCDGQTSFNVDQWLHVVCKVGYVAVLCLR
jgi:hypothetical protein